MSGNEIPMRWVFFWTLNQRRARQFNSNDSKHEKTDEHDSHVDDEEENKEENNDTK